MEIKQKAKEVYNDLKQVFNLKKSEFKPTLNILEKILTNITKNPGVDKFRIIKKQNKVLQKKLFVHEKIDKTLLTMGFVYDNVENTYTYYLPETAGLNTFLVVLDGLGVELESYENNKNADPEKVKVRKLMIDNEVNKLAEVKKEIERKMKMDRKEKEQYLKDHPSYNAKGNELKFGAKIKKCSDILPPPSS